MKNWAGSHEYAAARIHRPTSVEQLQELVAGSRRVRALGTRHSFTDLADTTGDLVSTLDLPPTVDVGDTTVRVAAGVRYGDLALRLHEHRLALATMASLPHISVGGAVATGTHGSGDRTGSLAAAVAALDHVGADGELHRVARGEEDFAGHVVALGALGVTTHVTLDVEPAYDVRQDLFTDLDWDAVDLDELTGAAYSVSLFTGWTNGRIDQAWLKSRGTEAPVLAAEPAATTLHMLAGADVAAVTEQGGRPGPWHERLPHFRLEFTPSRGEELQSEYLLPRRRAAEAVDALRRLAPGFAHLLQVSEVRTIAADDLWLSGAYAGDAVGLHFTWVRDRPAVYAALPAIEAALLPLGARPHWGKCFVATADQLAPAYPRLGDFRDLAGRLDPERKLRNEFLARHVGLEWTNEP
ncbi:FAD-binding protein [Nocardioides sp. URHA0032]|uniref:FAD-binding protein n=1 Tax=Nocardioides sp. URHA0032 TaxID=1380388 RepID=UPI000490528B|nr:FAD-binding protein [Nocardioides sp. URHA0032]